MQELRRVGHCRTRLTVVLTRLRLVATLLRLAEVVPIRVLLIPPGRLLLLLMLAVAIIPQLSRRQESRKCGCQHLLLRLVV